MASPFVLVTFKTPSAKALWGGGGGKQNEASNAAGVWGSESLLFRARLRVRGCRSLSRHLDRQQSGCCASCALGRICLRGERGCAAVRVPRKHVAPISACCVDVREASLHTGVCVGAYKHMSGICTHVCTLTPTYTAHAGLWALHPGVSSHSTGVCYNGTML